MDLAFPEEDISLTNCVGTTQARLCKNNWLHFKYYKVLETKKVDIL